MTKFLRKLADEKAPVFWCLGMLVFMILGYKTFSTVFLGKTGFSYDATFLRLSLLLIVRMGIVVLDEIARKTLLSWLMNAGRLMVNFIDDRSLYINIFYSLK